MAAPAIPSNVYVQQGNSQVYLSWDIVPGASTYPVLRSTDGVTFAQIAAPAVNNYLDTSVTVNTLYYYQVQASNGTASPSSPTQTAIATLTGKESLAALRLQAQQRADRVNSNFVTVPEWNKYINQSATELQDIMITDYEDYSLAVPYQFTTDGSLNMYDIPADLYKLMGVDLGQAQNNNARVTVHKFDFIERNRYVYPNITSTFLGVFNLRYRLMGDKLHFIPTPASGQIVTLWYVPRLPIMLKDTDVLDGINGWTEYVIVDAAIKALQKEESDVSVLMAQKQALLDRIQSSAMNRDAGMPDTISNTRGTNSGGYGGPGFDGSFGGF